MPTAGARLARERLHHQGDDRHLPPRPFMLTSAAAGSVTSARDLSALCADRRLDLCPYGAGKPTCVGSFVLVHCYQPRMREAVKDDDATAGPADAEAPPPSSPCGTSSTAAARRPTGRAAERRAASPSPTSGPRGRTPHVTASGRPPCRGLQRLSAPGLRDRGRLVRRGLRLNYATALYNAPRGHRRHRRGPRRRQRRARRLRRGQRHRASRQRRGHLAPPRRPRSPSGGSGASGSPSRSSASSSSALALYVAADAAKTSLARGESAARRASAWGSPSPPCPSSRCPASPAPSGASPRLMGAPPSLAESQQTMICTYRPSRRPPLQRGGGLVVLIRWRPWGCASSRTRGSRPSEAGPAATTAAKLSAAPLGSPHGAPGAKIAGFPSGQLQVEGARPFPTNDIGYPRTTGPPKALRRKGTHTDGRQEGRSGRTRHQHVPGGREGPARPATARSSIRRRRRSRSPRSSATSRTASARS